MDHTSVLPRVLLAALVGFAIPAPAADPPPRTVRDILQQLAQTPVDTARRAELRAILGKAPEAGADKKAIAKQQLARANAAEELGDGAKFVELMAEVVAAGGADDPLWEMDRLAIGHLFNGDFSRAIDINAKAITATGDFGARLVSRQGIRALMLGLQGNIDEAERTLGMAERTYESLRRLPIWPAWGSIWTVNTAQPRSLILMSRGKLVEAEAEARRALAAAEEDVENNKSRLARQFATPPQKFIESRRDQVLDQLARIVALQGRGTEAEAIARQGLQNTLKREGGHSAQAGQRLMHLSVVLLYEGRFEESRALAAASLGVLGKAGVPETSFFSFTSRRVLANALHALEKYPEAMAEYQRLGEVFKGVPDMQAYLAAGDAGWAGALLKTGRPEEALAMAGRLLALQGKWLGDAHADTAMLHATKAMALASLGRDAEAWQAFALAMPIVLREAAGQGEEASLLTNQRLRFALEGYLEFLAAQRGKPLEQSSGTDFVAEAFRVADVLRSQGTQLAVASAAARSAAGDPSLGGEIRKEQDLNNELASLYRILRGLVEAPPAQQLPQVMADMQRRIATIKQEQAALRERIRQRFPAYANLSRPLPPTLAQARAALKPGEALVATLSTNSATYAWAFGREGPVAFSRSTAGHEAMAGIARSIRRGLEEGDVAAAVVRGFDLASAHRLYREVLEPVAAGWSQAQSLFVTVNGALGQVPFGLLVTAPAKDLGEAQWLIRKAAISQLPSVNTLVTLRSLPAAAAQRAPFLGFGDPQFSPGTAPRAGTVRALQVQAQAEWQEYAKLTPLPDTREELLAVAKVLGADPSQDLFLGAAASKANLLKLDLTKRRIVAFATHGLLPGEFPGVSEPALALASPGDGRHGLLTLEDILKLKLDADWVVLSACNTAAGDGAGADAVSGLGRGFFYAGGRSLLVTHWPVETVSARLLVTGTFERYAKDPKLSRSEALRQSMLALMDADPKYRHPLFWAPYALVGDGGER